MSRPGLKRVLVLGGAGYLGSVLVSRLLRRKMNVRVLDSFLFGNASLSSFRRDPRCEVICGDIRDLDLVASLLTDSDAVIHLAAVVGDAACEENRHFATEVNEKATSSLVGLAARSGVRRFIFASSCSVYGSSDGLFDEDSPLRPLSLYARMKVNSERALLSARDANFAPVVLRLGTLFGLSPRMRFDLVLNHFVAQASASNKIVIYNGRQWRPFLHVQDAAEAFIACLQADPNVVAGQVFNAGSPEMNYQIQELAKAVSEIIPNTTACINEAANDRRNYRGSFQKIRKALPFRCRKTLASGISEICAAIRSGALADTSLEKFNNAMALRRLTEARKQAALLWNEDHRAKRNGDAVFGELEAERRFPSRTSDAAD